MRKDSQGQLGSDKSPYAFGDEENGLEFDWPKDESPLLEKPIISWQDGVYTRVKFLDGTSHHYITGAVHE